jgi:hypothetical protein
MAKIKYTQSDVEEFMGVAEEMGIGPAMRKLGYPAGWGTAQRWFEQAGKALPTIDSLVARAAELKVFYQDKEKLMAVQTLIDRIVEQLTGEDLTADEINKLGNALNKAIQTFNLIEGKSTSISESRTKDGADLAIMDMLNEAKAKNSRIEADL